MSDEERKRVVGDAYEMDALIARTKDQAQRITELERLRAYWNDVAIDLGAQLCESDKANATLTAQLGTAREGLTRIATEVIGSPSMRQIAKETLAALGTAQDGTDVKEERAHICGDPNDACDMLCVERAYVAAQKVQKERKARDAKEGQDG